MRFVIILGYLFFSAMHSAYADNTVNIVIFNEKSAYQKTFYRHLLTYIDTTKIEIISIDSSEISTSKVAEKNPSLIINLDKTLTESLINLGVDTPIFHTLITIADSQKLLPCKTPCISRKNHFFVLDQPPSRTLGLIQLIDPNASNIGVIYSKNSMSLLRSIQKKSINTPQHIKGFSSDSTSLGFILNDVAKSSDIILAVADTSIYNASTLPQILLTSYRHRTPVIGFSKSFIKAGAVSGVLSNLQQLAKQLAENILEHHNKRQILSKGIIYPKYFSVMSNRRVASSLNLHFDDDKKLTSVLISRELP
ncbi:MAG: ABC transporter substrate-binding protein [Piscirickettsiaceae bacterium]|nr:MAG: ABC transporter substrate-binding protein [Piscirickettsiaceae bacterium]